MNATNALVLEQGRGPQAREPRQRGPIGNDRSLLPTLKPVAPNMRLQSMRPLTTAVAPSRRADHRGCVQPFNVRAVQVAAENSPAACRSTSAPLIGAHGAPA